MSGLNGGRIFAAVSLAVLLAGVGACSTNYTPGNGHPTNSPSYGTGLGPSSLGSSSGTEGMKPQSELILAPELITPMYSSASEAAGVLAGHQGRFLGFANPGPPSPDYGKDTPTGQLVPPAMITNPEQTVNSSISSEPTPVITSGAGGDEGGAVVIGGVSAAAATPATAGSFAAGPGANVAASSTNVNQNTGILTPTVSSAITPSPTAAANPPIGLPSTVAPSVTAAVTSAATNTPSTTSTRSRAVARPPAGRVARPVHMTTSSGGNVVITNQ